MDEITYEETYELKITKIGGVSMSCPCVWVLTKFAPCVPNVFKWNACILDIFIDFRNRFQYIIIFYLFISIVSILNISTFWISFTRQKLPHILFFNMSIGVFKIGMEVIDVSLVIPHMILSSWTKVSFGEVDERKNSKSMQVFIKALTKFEAVVLDVYAFTCDCICCLSITKVETQICFLGTMS